MADRYTVVTMADRYTVEKALELVHASEDKVTGVLLEHGTLELGFYKPEGIDPQQPHIRDGRRTLGYDPRCVDPQELAAKVSKGWSREADAELTPYRGA
ncbi:MAG: hypothetical protein MJE77_11195 [Proteobacteria bacterium]|nr:hypothetical protein [Pseudomonadota bacterium]